MSSNLVFNILKALDFVTLAASIPSCGYFTISQFSRINVILSKMPSVFHCLFSDVLLNVL